MEQTIETRVKPAKVWSAWERAHATHGQAGIVEGQKGTSSKLKYQVIDVIPNRQFTIRWKTLFVRLLFTHEVNSSPRGAIIRYSVQIKGLFAWPVRWFLGKKIEQNISLVLKKMVQQLEG